MADEQVTTQVTEPVVTETPEVKTQEQQVSQKEVKAPEQKIENSWEQEKKQMSGKIQKLQNDLNSVTNGMPLEQVVYLRDTGLTMETLASQNDAFKERLLELVDKAQKGELTKAEAKELENKTEKAVAEAPKTPTPQIINDPALKWAREQMDAEAKKREQFFAELEGEEKESIDAKTFFDKETMRNRNLIRETIGSYAKMLVTQQGLSEQDAFKKAFTVVVHPERLREEGELSGINQALQSKQVSGVIAGGTGKPEASITVPSELKEGYEYRLKKYGKERADKYVKEYSKKL